MTKLFNIVRISLIFSLLLFSSCNKTENQPTPENGTSKKLTIFIMNDIHAQIDNFSKVKHIVDLERKETNVILTCAGDIFSGNPIVDNYPEKGYPIIDIMNKIGVDVAELGNHEFDYGENNLKNRLEQSNFDWICANVDMSNSIIEQPHPFTSIEVDNLKITFFGLIETNGKQDATIPATHPWRVRNITFRRPENVVSEYKDLKTKENSDLLIALTHIGRDQKNGRLGDHQLANKFPFFDMIIGGHSHSIANDVVNNIPIFQAGGYLNKLGRIRLEIKDKKIISLNYNLLDLNRYSEKDSDIATLIDDYNESPFLNKIIGYSSRDHNRAIVGCFVADVLRKDLKVDVTFQNSGGVRTALDKGNIIRKEIYEILPFNNPMMKYNMTVAEIKTFLKGSGTGVYYSGVKIEKTNNHVIIKNMNDQIITEDKVLSVALNDYIPAVYDSYFPKNGEVLDKTDAETVIDYLEKNNEAIDYNGCTNYFRF